MEHKQPKRPRDLTGYFESMTRTVFSSGISWRVVEAKWPGIRAAFRGLDPVKVARMTPRDLDRLSKDTRVIRNVPKLEAIVTNAREVVALEKDPGGFRGYLKSLGSFEDAGPALRKKFRYLGESGAYYFLWSVGEKVPDWHTWRETRERPRPAARGGAGARRPAARRK